MVLPCVLNGLPCVVNGFSLCCEWVLSSVVNGITLCCVLVYLVLWMGVVCYPCCFFGKYWFGGFLVFLLNTDQVLYYWFLINFVLRFFITFKDITLLGFLLTQESVMSLSLPDFNGILVLELLYQNSQLFDGFCFWYICQSKSNLYVL